MTVSDILQAQETYFPGQLTDEQVEAYAPGAIAFVSILTARRSDSATGWKLDRAKLAVCTAMRMMVEADAALSDGGARLNSVSNDGYTETYAAEASQGSAIAAKVRECMSGTGLVSLL